MPTMIRHSKRKENNSYILAMFYNNRWIRSETAYANKHNAEQAKVALLSDPKARGIKVRIFNRIAWKFLDPKYKGRVDVLSKRIIPNKTPKAKPSKQQTVDNLKDQQEIQLYIGNELRKLGL